MVNSADLRSIPELVSGLVADLSSLFRKEINLAKAEASEKMSNAFTGIELIAVGLVFSVAALGVLLAALVKGIAVFLISRGMTEASAETLSSVIVGIVVGIIAWAMIARGRSALRAGNLTLDQTTASLRRDAQIIKEKT